MKLVLATDIVGTDSKTGIKRLFAKQGDIVPALIKGNNYYWSISNIVKDTSFIIFKSQILEKLEEHDISDNEEGSIIDESGISDITEFDPSLTEIDE